MKTLFAVLAVASLLVTDKGNFSVWFNENFIDYVEGMPFTFGDGSL